MCSAGMVQKYFNRISDLLLDRIDIHITIAISTGRVGLDRDLCACATTFADTVVQKWVFSVTSNEKGFPFEVKINERKMQGVILADQVKSLDWKKRESKFIFTGFKTN